MGTKDRIEKAKEILDRMQINRYNDPEGDVEKVLVQLFKICENLSVEIELLKQGQQDKIEFM